MKKILFADTETTGLTERHAIIQIAGIIDIDFKTVDEFDICMAPRESDLISDQALEINGRTREEIAKFQHCQDGKKHFTRQLDKHVSKFIKSDKLTLIGYNVGYDKRMISSLFHKCGDKYLMSYISYPEIDVAQMVALRMSRTGERKNLPNMKLGTVGIYCGLIEDDSQLHDAMADIRLTRDLFYMLYNSSNQSKSLKEEGRIYMEWKSEGGM